MNKALLSMAIVASVSLSAMADQYTFVFDGNDDMAGLTRQTTTKVNDMTFVKEIKMAEAGIDFALTSPGGTGNGFALVNDGTNAGIYISSQVDTQISLTLPDGNITAVKLTMKGYALPALELNFNEKVISATDAGPQTYSWIWNDAENGESVYITWPFTYMPRYIRSIEVTYTPNLGGKQECGLVFGEESLTAFVGETVSSPELTNPFNLPIVWSSSNPEIASVDAEGNVTLLAGGKTYITASTEGNDKYAAGNARYQLTSIPVAHSLTEMIQLAPNPDNMVKVECPLTVMFARSVFAYVQDAEGTPGYIKNTKYDGNTDAKATIYKPGEIIPAGWVATYTKVTQNSSTFYWGGQPENVTETTEVEYPKVTSISTADNNRVLTLLNVKFTGNTPSGNTKAFGTTPDGKTYEFQDTFEIGDKPAGTYDVTGVVFYSLVGDKQYFWMAPISYVESKDNGVETINSDDSSATRYFNLQGIEVIDPHNGIFIRMSNGQTSKVIFK